VPQSGDPRTRAAKAALRRATIGHRDALPAAARASAGERITEELLALPEFASAQAVLSYASFGNEFDTAAFNRSVLSAGKALFLPRVVRAERRLRLYSVTSLERDLVAGTWGIPEPDPARCPEVGVETADCVLVPGVAFDRGGGRLGYGGGFYDRLLPGAAADTPLVAAAFSVQVVEAVPVESFDRRITILVTDLETVRIR
jgi:5-formyltetrahydrofolate cyclo-ligase